MSYIMTKKILNFHNLNFEQFIAEKLMYNNPLKGVKCENAIKWQAFGEGSRHCVANIYSSLVLKLNFYHNSN